MAASSTNKNLFGVPEITKTHLQNADPSTLNRALNLLAQKIGQGSGASSITINTGNTISGGGTSSTASSTSGRRSVLDYGAVGNGSTDDSGAFNAASTAASTGGFAIYIPSGYNFLLNHPVTVQSN